MTAFSLVVEPERPDPLGRDQERALAPRNHEAGRRVTVVRLVGARPDGGRNVGKHAAIVDPRERVRPCTARRLVELVTEDAARKTLREPGGRECGGRRFVA